MANRFAGTLWGQLESERDRWPLWLPVMLGAGAGVYFALPAEPPVAMGWACVALALTAAGLAVAGRARWLLAMAAALLLGFGLAKLRESAAATPVLNHAVVAHLTGRIVSLEPRATGVRVVLDEVRSGALDPVPRRVRIALRSGGDFHPGDWLSPALGSKHT